MKAYPIYEVKHSNTTLEWTTSVVEAKERFDSTHGAKLYQLNPSTGAKVLIDQKVM